LKILTIIGARPQFIKASALSKTIKDSYNFINEIIIHTGQHYDSNMSKIFFDELHIPKPKYNLGIGGGTHGENTGRMIESIEKIILFEKPNWVVVFGDTDSTLAASVAASKLNIKVAHVEAGLRSFNKKMPEEINRILTDHVSEILFTPTNIASQNLISEGISPIKIKQVGDIMYDAILKFRHKKFKPNFLSIDEDQNFGLCTIHRAENTNDLKKLENIFEQLNIVSKKVKIVLPIHPRTLNALEKTNFNLHNNNLAIIEPVGYFEMNWLLDKCRFVITDSGGLQKEAFFYKKPALILREETEWIELIEHGFNKIVSADESKILNQLSIILESNLNFDTPLYGNGKTSNLIIDFLLNYSN
jgi:UDP-GlcNAc3NAcA epimerase